MNLISRTKIRSLKGRGERGRWLRAMIEDPEEEAGSVLGNSIRGGRVNPPHSFAVLYFFEVRKFSPTSTLEVLKDEDGKLPDMLLVDVEVDLERILDLTDESVRRRLGVTIEGFNDTDDMRMAQAVGAAAFRAGFQGLVYPRAGGKNCRNLALFLDRVTDESVRLLSATRLHELAEGSAP